MEETTDANVHQEDSARCAVDAKTTAKASSSAARRNSLIELRRRDAATNQLRGLVIPAVSSAQGQGARSSVGLPTISSTKPSSKLMLSSTTQECPRHSGYQSVLARPGLPFMSTLRPTTSDVQRRNSLHGLPLLQQSSAPSWSRSLVEPSEMSLRVNNVSVVSEEAVDSSQHTNVLRSPESELSSANIDATGGAADKVPALESNILPHNSDEGFGDNNISSSSASRQLEASLDVSMSESVTVSDLKTDKRHKTQQYETCHVNDVVEPITRSCPPDHYCDLQNSTCDDLIEIELASPGCQAESVDHSVVSSTMSPQVQPKSVNNGPLRSCPDSVQAGDTAVDADGGEWVSSLSLVDGRLNGHANDTLTDSHSVPPSDTDDVTNVIINKGNLGLGFCISGGRASTGDNPVVVKRVFKGETLLQSILHPGDEIVSANDIDLGGMSQHEAWTVLKSLPDGSVRLAVRRRH